MTPYISISAAVDYFALRLNTEAWDRADATNQEKALAMATDAINRLNFVGEMTDSNQENQFPRGGDTEVPQDIQEACAELAMRLLDGVDPELEFENLSMVSQGYSNVRSTYDRTTPAEHVVAGIVSITAWRKLKPYLRDSRTVELHRVS
jgi:hypothetical protein